MKKTKKRRIARNADDALRRAQRAMQTDPTRETITKYWLECFRAGKLPEPTRIENIDYKIWSLDDTPWGYDMVSTGGPSPDIVEYCDIYKKCHWIATKSEEEKERVIKSFLQALIEKRRVVTRGRAKVDNRFRLALPKLNPRKKRRNADDAIRKLEREAFRGVAIIHSKFYEIPEKALKENRDAIIAYWRACIQADMLPKPTSKMLEGDEWEIPGECRIFKHNMGLSSCFAGGFGLACMKGGYLLDPIMLWTGEEADGEVMKRLKTALDYFDKLESKENPPKRRIARNADDALRKLERKAKETQAPEDIANYWRFVLKTGDIPEPTKTGGFKGNNAVLEYDYTVWTLYPKVYKIAAKNNVDWFKYPAHVARMHSYSGEEFIWFVYGIQEIRMPDLTSALSKLIEIHDQGA